MEKRRSYELIPGVTASFTETGIDSDVVNAWTTNHVKSLVGDFDRLQPVRHYAEYFQDQDKKYEAAGQRGLYKAVMERSNPKTVAAFDDLVDEFNNSLPQIKEKKDIKIVQEYINRLDLLKRKLPEEK